MDSNKKCLYWKFKYKNYTLQGLYKNDALRSIRSTEGCI